MDYPVTLGGYTFDVPSLPWRVVKQVQPGLLALVGGLPSNERGVRITAADADAIGNYIFQAIALSPQGQTLTREAFEELPIALLEMAEAVNPILRACGLKFDKPGEGADPKA